jgi:hypothetical protein
VSARTVRRVFVILRQWRRSTAKGAFSAIQNTDLAAGNETGAGVGHADAGLCLFTSQGKLA